MLDVIGMDGRTEPFLLPNAYSLRSQFVVVPDSKNVLAATTTKKKPSNNLLETACGTTPHTFIVTPSKNDGLLRRMLANKFDTQADKQ
jgi:hypothetical protein